MLVEQEKLLSHLKKISCGGLIREAVLRRDLSCSAITVDKTVLVNAPPLEGVEPLTEKVGVIDLELLIGFVASACYNPDAQVSIELANERMVIEGETGWVRRMITGSTSVIGTQIHDENLEKVLALIPEDKGAPLPQSVVEGVQKDVSLTGSDEVTLHISPDGTRFVVGVEQAHVGEKHIASLRDDQEYALSFDADSLVNILKQIDDFTQSQLTFSGPDTVMAVDATGYRYIISPMEEEA